MHTHALVLATFICTCLSNKVRMASKGAQGKSVDEHQDVSLKWWRPKRSIAESDAVKAIAMLLVAFNPSSEVQNDVDQFLSEARRVLRAQRSLAERLAAIRAKADRFTEQMRESAKSCVNYHGMEDAPAEIKQRLEAMTTGSFPYPRNAEVQHLWDTMSTAPSLHDTAASFGAWSHWRLRELGAEILNSPRSTQSVKDTEEGAFAAEVSERWLALSQGLEEGAPGQRAELQKDASDRRVEAYVTHLTNDDYVLGACTLAASLAATQTTRPLLALVTDGVSATGRRTLHDAGWALVDVTLVGLEEKDAVQIRGYFSKIWLWALPCHSVIYIDTDVIVLENLDHLFSSAGGRELAAVPDSLPHIDGKMEVQAGLMVVEPSPRRFADLWEVICGSRRPDHLDDLGGHHEQAFLASYFDGDRGVDAMGPGDPRPQWQILPAKYNFNIRYLLRPLYEGLRPSNTAIVHFAVCKPWDLSQRDYAPPAYVQLFLEFAQAISVPWRPGKCLMDELRLQWQQEQFRQWMAKQQQSGF